MMKALLLVVASAVLSACGAGVVQSNYSGGGGSVGFTSKLEVPVHPDGSPVVHANEIEGVPVGTTAGGTPVTGIGGHGPYSGPGASAPDPAPEPTPAPATEGNSFGPVSN